MQRTARAWVLFTLCAAALLAVHPQEFKQRHLVNAAGHRTELFGGPAGEEVVPKAVPRHQLLTSVLHNFQTLQLER